MFDEKAYYRQYYAKNKEKLDKRARQWVKEHPESEVKRHAKYRKENKDLIRDRTAEWREENKDHLKQWYKEYRSSCPKTFLTKKLGQVSAKRRKRTLEIAITVEYLESIWSKQNGRCAITEYELSTQFGTMYTASIDRIDSQKGYIEGNIQIVCQSINFAKNAFSNEQAIEFWQGRPKLYGSEGYDCSPDIL